MSEAISEIRDILGAYDGYMVPRVFRGINASADCISGTDLSDDLDPASAIIYRGPLTDDLREQLIRCLDNEG